MSEPELNALSERIIGLAFQVSNTLGSGFLESVYVKALVHDLTKNGFKAKAGEPVKVYYDNIEVGDFLVDILVNDTIILEIKAAVEHHEVFAAQCLNYLKATRLPLCLLINFGKPKVEVKRYRR